MSWQILFLASATEMIGALVQGCSGIGLNLVAIPVLLLVAPSFVPVATLGTAVVLTAAVLVRDYIPGIWPKAWPCLVGRAPGSLFGIELISRVSAAGLEITACASILIGVAGASRSRAFIPQGRGWAVFAGCLAAFFGTTVSVGGPPLAIYYSSESSRSLRALIALNGLIGSALSLVLLGWIGLVGPKDLTMLLALLPGLGLGFVVSTKIRNYLDGVLVKRLAFGIAAVSAIWLGIRAVHAIAG